MLSQASPSRIKHLPEALAGNRGHGTPVSQSEVTAAVTLFREGRISDALSTAQALAKRSPDLVPLLDLQGACLKAQGDLLGALDFFKRSLEAGGNPAIGHFNIGAILLQLNYLDLATEHLSKAVVLDPKNPAASRALAMSLNEQGHYAEAVHIISALIENNPVTDELLNVLGLSLRRLNRLTEAKACYNSVTPASPAGGEAQYQLGLIAVSENRNDTAKQHFQNALDLNPRLTPVHRNMSLVITYDKDHPHLRDMQQLLNEGDLQPSAESELRFALYKALNDTRQYDAAFEHLEQGNSLKKQTIRYSIEKDEGIFAYLKHTFAEPAPVATSELGFRPIFIVGLPRSGTTVTERILCGCEGVTGAGELQYSTTAMSKLMQQMATKKQTKFTQADAQALRDAVGQAMQGHANGAPVVIDKMPLNFRWVGGLLAAFPEARIVYTTRMPRDQLWSLYQVCMAGSGNGFSYDLSDIAQYQALTRDLMQHWMRLFPDQIHQLDYHALTKDPEEHIRPLVDFCGLEWSDDCLHPENRESAIQTASLQQARQPIYHRSTPDWLPHEARLSSAFEQLNQLGL